MRKNRIWIIPFVVIGMVLIYTNSWGMPEGNELSFITDSHEETLEIGDRYAGGIVLYIFQPGDHGYVPGEVHGLIAAPEDQGDRIQWGCSGTEIGCNSTELGAGRANTIAIVDFHDNLKEYYENPTRCHWRNDGTVAAKICNDLELNGYSDWYLPSKEELQILRQNRLVIGLPHRLYWSSSEYGTIFAWEQYGGYFGAGYKYEPASVRCIRTF